MTLESLGDLDMVEASYALAEALFEQALGPASPNVGVNLGPLGDVALERGECSDSRPCPGRAPMPSSGCASASPAPSQTRTPRALWPSPSKPEGTCPTRRDLSQMKTEGQTRAKAGSKASDATLETVEASLADFTAGQE
ncbi:hypothetical protein PPSIR1_01297 [Plesiocystis pacifica SIR-1]|uniref:Uncharacterized protein n=1 Tax=Plesiocystis pacifica SIR-1 TaxID=391625 RepID=A6G8B0_9BACT|nr:hypothetical protein PPSIR1_01297 [Plesiocystis pacifica SIR-1]